jgi:crossover junction endodeoxyribonuclease RuvC
VVLGVDPGLTRCGLGALVGPSSRPRLVEATCVRTDPALPTAERLHRLRLALSEAVERLSPAVVAVERVLFSANARTAMATGQAAGVALLVAAESGLPVVAYSPNEVKLTVAGDGAADKAAVARLVRAQLGVASLPGPVDVTDALAVALTHLARSRADGLTTTITAGGTARAVATERADALAVGLGGWEARVAGHRIVSSTGGPVAGVGA